MRREENRRIAWEVLVGERKEHYPTPPWIRYRLANVNLDDEWESQDDEWESQDDEWESQDDEWESQDDEGEETR
jgi:hypothetical protein